MDISQEFFHRLGRRTKIALANRDRLILDTFREEALRVMDAGPWQEVLAKCDKYKADMQKKGRL